MSICYTQVNVNHINQEILISDFFLKIAFFDGTKIDIKNVINI